MASHEVKESKSTGQLVSEWVSGFDPVRDREYRENPQLNLVVENVLDVLLGERGAKHTFQTAESFVLDHVLRCRPYGEVFIMMQHFHRAFSERCLQRLRENIQDTSSKSSHDVTAQVGATRDRITKI